MKLKYQRTRRYWGYLKSTIIILWYVWITVALYMIGNLLQNMNIGLYYLNQQVGEISYWLGFVNNGN